MRHHQAFSSVRAFRWVSPAVALAVFLAACDPIRVISVSREIDRPPDDSCVVSVLRASGHVRTAGVSSDGTVFAELAIPPGIDPPNPRRKTELLVQESQTKAGKIDFTFRVLWVGVEGSTAYHRYVEKILRKLQSAALEACSH